MLMATPDARKQLDFLLNLQRLLEEGEFTASYKFALLLALAELSVTKGDDSGATLTIQTRDLADQFVRLYWRQMVPFPTPRGAVTLRQISGDRSAILDVIDSARQEHDGSIVQFIRSANKETRIGKVARTVSRYPLKLLQKAGGREYDFLYDPPAAENPSSITLKPGVAYCFRAFYPMITELVQGAWVEFIRRTNTAALGPESELRDFLFGTERRTLAKYREVLVPAQEERCFYCTRPLQAEAGAVDHFIPWRRVPIDLGHNFVVAHDRL